MIFNVSGGGGTALNFRVVGGTTAPSNPKENTIWVNTSTDITSWVFSATQPTAASGRVWISVGTSSVVEFNALKKNGIQVYPISAKQYVSGVWVDKPAKSYQNGEWVEWITYLLNGSDFCDSLTGGWEFYKDVPSWSMGVYQVTSDGVILNPTGNNSTIAMQTVNKINFDNIKTLEVDMESLNWISGASNALNTHIYLTSEKKPSTENVGVSNIFPIVHNFL
mgnify:CR=1 FL=1